MIIQKGGPVEPCGDILDDMTELLACFEKGWTYPIRPLLMYTKYAYKLLHVVNPDLFFVEINDRPTAAVKDGIQEALKKYEETVTRRGTRSLKLDKLQEMLPVIVKDNDGKFHRAEVNKTTKDEANVTLVDAGGERWVPASKIYPPSTELLRYPKLAMPCLLGQVIPAKGGVWRQMNYAALFEGKSTSLLEATSVLKGICEVHLECDGIDVGFNIVMNLEGIADFIPNVVRGVAVDEHHLGKYPLSDFTAWMGQKINVFGSHVFRVGKTKGKQMIAAYIQLDPSTPNTVWERLDEWASTNETSTQPFPKNIGDPIIVRHNGDLYRGTITKKSLQGFMVKLVDYGEHIYVKDEPDTVMAIPTDLVDIPEGATACYLAEIMVAEHTDDLKQRLGDLIKEKDMFARILDCNSLPRQDIEADSPRYIVTLSRQDTPEGLETPFSEILGLVRVPTVENLSHIIPCISQSLATKLLGGTSAYYPGQLYDGVLSSIDDVSSIWLQLEGDDARATDLTHELNSFYDAWDDCPPLDPSKIPEDTFLAAQMNPNGEEEYDNCWYRARVIKIIPEKQLFRVLFLDYGNEDVVSVDKLKPLPSYFGKDKSFALQVALPVDILPGVAADVALDFIQDYIECKDLQVVLQHEDTFNYAWITTGIGQNLCEDLVKRKLAKLKFDPPK